MRMKKHLQSTPVLANEFSDDIGPFSFHFLPTKRNLKAECDPFGFSRSTIIRSAAYSRQRTQWRDSFGTSA